MSSVGKNWKIDEIIMNYWETEGSKEKKKLELECYKEFKNSNFDPSFIDYLRENDCQDLADEMQHFAEIYQKVPHEHEKRLAA